MEQADRREPGVPEEECNVMGIALALQRMIKNIDDIRAHLPNTFKSAASRMVPEECTLQRIAESEIHRRQVRGRYLSKELADGPGWTILVELFNVGMGKTCMKVSDLYRSAAVSQQTGSRFISYLVDSELAMCANSKIDGNIEYVRMTPKGNDAVARVLAAYHY